MTVTVKYFSFFLVLGLFEIHHMNSWKLALPSSKNKIQQTAEVNETSSDSPKILLSSWEDMGNSLVKRGSKPHPNYQAFALTIFFIALMLQDISLAGNPENLSGTSGLQNALYFVLHPSLSLHLSQVKKFHLRKYIPLLSSFWELLKREISSSQWSNKSIFDVLALWEVYKS